MDDQAQEEGGMPQPGTLTGAALAEDELDPDWRPEDYDFDPRNLTVQKSGEHQQFSRMTSSIQSSEPLRYEDRASTHAQKARRRQTGVYIIKVKIMQCMNYAEACSRSIEIRS